MWWYSRGVGRRRCRLSDDHEHDDDDDAVVSYGWICHLGIEISEEFGYQDRNRYLSQDQKMKLFIMHQSSFRPNR